jgi:hypothetical protein
VFRADGHMGAQSLTRGRGRECVRQGGRTPASEAANEYVFLLLLLREVHALSPAPRLGTQTALSGAHAQNIVFILFFWAWSGGFITTVVTMPFVLTAAILARVDDWNDERWRWGAHGAIHLVFLACFWWTRGILEIVLGWVILVSASIPRFGERVERHVLSFSSVLVLFWKRDLVVTLLYTIIPRLVAIHVGPPQHQWLSRSCMLVFYDSPRWFVGSVLSLFTLVGSKAEAKLQAAERDAARVLEQAEATRRAAETERIQARTEAAEERESAARARAEAEEGAQAVRTAAREELAEARREAEATREAAGRDARRVRVEARAEAEQLVAEARCRAPPPDACACAVPRR